MPGGQEAIMDIKVNCLSCGHTLDLGETYEEYEGDFTCWVCQAKLMVHFCRGKLVEMTKAGAPAQPDVFVISDDGQRTAFTTTSAKAAAHVIEAIHDAR
jgi:hypothetical protein